MLKELVLALLKQVELRGEFRRDPAHLLKRFGVTEAERSALLDGNEAGLVTALGTELLSSFRALDISPGLGYPGYATLDVKSITVVESNGKCAGVDIQLGWEHPGLPTQGLPTWMQVEIIKDDTSLAMASSQYLVPSALNFDTGTALIRDPSALKPGKYKLIVRTTHPEVRDSKWFPFVIER